MQTVFVVFCFLLGNVITQDTPSSPSAINCEELTSHIQNLKESTKSKKDKFSCILNLLKGALTDELENSQCHEEKPIIELSNLEKVSEKVAEVTPENEKSEDKNEQTELYDLVLTKVTQDKKKKINYNTQNLEVPTMIPIFKPKPNNQENFQPSRTRSIPEAVRANPNPAPTTPRFTIPCQRAADILDMSIAPKTEKFEQAVQTNLKPTSPVSSSNSANQKPTTVHCADLDESVAILFKPKAISLMQVYGNLLRKITVTVLVPYHMSKMGQNTVPT